MGVLFQRVILAQVLASRAPFLTTETLILLNYGSFFLFMYLLVGFFSLPLTILLIASAHVGLILSAILWGLLGSKGAMWGPRSYFAGAEWGGRHRYYAVLIVLVLPFLVGIGYPILVGTAYFNSALSSTEVTLVILRYTLGYFILSYLLLTGVTIAATASENLDNETRDRFFAVQLGGLVQNALFFALAIWAFGSPITGVQYSISGISLAVSPLLIAVLVLYFLLMIFSPYLVGTRRSKKQRQDFLAARSELLKDLMSCLTFPVVSQQIPKVEELQAKVDGKLREFQWLGDLAEFARRRAAHPQVDSSTGAPVNPSEEYLVKSLEALMIRIRALPGVFLDSKKLDPRVEQFDWLQTFSDRLKELESDLKGKTGEDEVRKAAASWAESSKAEKIEVDEKIIAVTETKSPVAIKVGAGITLVVTPIISKLVDWAWALTFQSLPK